MSEEKSTDVSLLNIIKTITHKLLGKKTINIFLVVPLIGDQYQFSDDKKNDINTELQLKFTVSYFLLNDVRYLIVLCYKCQI